MSSSNIQQKHIYTALSISKLNILISNVKYLHYSSLICRDNRTLWLYTQPMESGGSRIIQGQYCPLLVLILFGDFSGVDITHFRFNTSSGWSKPELSTTAACCLKQAIILNMMCQQAVRARSVNNTIRQGYQLSPVDLPLHAVTLLYNTHVWYRPRLRM